MVTGMHPARPTRRQALTFLGAGAGLHLLRAQLEALPLARPLQSRAPARSVTFPKGAIIRTILKDLSPETLNGDILFHEHLDGVYSRDTRQLKLPPPSL